MCDTAAHDVCFTEVSTIMDDGDENEEEDERSDDDSNVTAMQAKSKFLILAHKE